MSDDEYPTNTANPNHNPDQTGMFPKTAGEWAEGDLSDSIDPSSVDSDKWVDSRGSPYDPETGSSSPTPNRCNAVLDNYEERFGERRYCGILPLSQFDDSVEHDYCDHHKERASFDIQAEEVLQNGLSAKSRDHVYRKLPDWQRLYIYGLYEGLMGLSTYEFAPEYELTEFDFTDAPFTPSLDQDGPIYRINVPHATENLDREVALWAAAVDGVKLELANAQIAEDEMTVEKTEHAQLTAPPSEHDPSPQQFETIETLVEHPLNTAYSRVVKDRKKLLQYGGVVVDGATSDDRSDLGTIDSLNVVEVETTDETPMGDKALQAGLDAEPAE